MSEVIKYVASTNEENFSGCTEEYGSVQEAFEAYVHDYGMDSGILYIGQKEDRTIGDYAPNVDSIINRMIEDSADEVGDVAEQWPLDRATREQRDELQDMLSDVISIWATKHGLQPNFFAVTNVEDRTVCLDEDTSDSEI